MYFLINVVIAFIGLVAFICIARKYRNLKRDDTEDNAHFQTEVDHNVNVETIA